MKFLEFLREATKAKGKTAAEKKAEAQEADNHEAITFGGLILLMLVMASSSMLLRHMVETQVIIESIQAGHKTIRKTP